MSSSAKQDRGLLGTSSSLLEKWSTASSSLLTGTSLSLRTTGSSGGQDTKRKLAEDSHGRVGEKKPKAGRDPGHLMGTSLTSSLLTSSLLTSSSSTSHASSLMSRLESPLSKMALGENRTLQLSQNTSGLASSLAAKPSFLISESLLKKTEPRAVKPDGDEQKKKKQVREGVDSSRSKLGKSKKKKMKLEGKITTGGAQNLEQYRMELPSYHLTKDENTGRPVELNCFIPPDKDAKLMAVRLTSSVEDVEGLKNGLVNAVSASLLCSPNFRDPRDQAREQLVSMTEKVMIYDPEFVLKVALYTRRELNIRTTTNFMLALAANRAECRPFLRKYYTASIMLPSDWIEVAEIYQAFRDKTLNFGSLPASLRRVMIAKFPDFDKYQLAKYNKDKAHQKKKKKENTATRGGGRGGRGRGRGQAPVRPGMKRKGDDSESSGDDDDDDADMAAYKPVPGVEYDEESETEEERVLKTFTLKQLIRKLHITEPVEHVMCLIGKKYPLTPEDFYKQRLPGTWEEERAGKRMKLPTPETWETQVSLKGNKAKTWEDLIDHKKLPFMAMLRNLRNLIKAGISQVHHSRIIRRLTDERQVANSKQFPFRFFSAYEVLQVLEKEYVESQKAIVESATAAAEAGSSGFGRGRGGRGRGGRGRGRGGKAEWWQKRVEKKKSPQETLYDERIIQRYRKALDTAVKIATVHNVQPIRGRTVIFCSLSQLMSQPCKAAQKGLGKPRTVAEVSLLLALMCKYSCEESELVVYNENAHCSVELEKGTILDNMERVLATKLEEIAKQQPCNTWDERRKQHMRENFPYWVLAEKLRDRVQIDNLIILDYNLAPTGSLGIIIGDFLRPYRRVVNPNLLYVSICAKSAGCRFDTNIKAEHENDVYISGFSDAILRFIAERGSGGQLLHVENIDKAYNLLTPTPLQLESVEVAKPVTLERPLPVSALKPRWRTARVFISSTFRDMHGERDLLTRFVFPELRALGRQHFINVFEVDLRWGVTEEDTSSNRTLELCLQELTKCQLFMGLLGSRYGWVPAHYQLPNTPEFDCVRQYQAGASVTELEMHFGALKDVPAAKEKAFFFLRNDSFEKDIPVGFKPDFLAESEESRSRLSKLKDRVRASGLEVFDSYPCRWGGVVDHKPMVGGLEEFGQRALNNLWLAVQRLYPDEDAVLDEDTHIMRLHRAFVDSRQGQFVGRKALIKQCINKVVAMNSGLLGLVGKPGCGKSSLMASVIHTYVESRHCISGSRVLVHMVGAAPGSSNLAATVRRLSHELKHTFGLDGDIPDDFKNLVVTFGGLLQEAGKLCGGGSPLVLFIDGLYSMDNTHQPCNLAWLPQPLPLNVVVVVTAVEGDVCHKSLMRLKAEVLSVGALDMFDKAEIVRQTLASHRKALDETPFNNQLKFLMMKKEAHNPLFLKMACEELRVFGVFEKVTSKLKAMSHTTQQLLQEVLQRLETDHGAEVVTTTMCLLICARDGLLSEELQELLAWHSSLRMSKEKVQIQDLQGRQFPRESALPPATFAFLQRSVQSFLNPLNSSSGAIHLTLAHSDIVTAVRQRYLRGSAAEKEQQLHRLLAGYFLRQADPGADQSWQGLNPRAFSELPYHLTCGGCFKELTEAVCSLRFIHSKCLVGVATQLMDDFAASGCTTKALEKEQAKFLANPRVQEYHAFVSSNLHVLSRHPNLTWQQARNSMAGSAACVEVQQLEAQGLIGQDGCVLWDNKPLTKDPCYMRLDNLSQPATCVAISPDNEYFATGGLDCLVRLYDMATGKELRFYRGHSDSIADVCFVSKSVLCSASLDATVSLWDVEQGHRIALLKGHGRRVNACTADRSGKVVASASWDTSVRVWNATSGEKICDFSLGCPVNDVKFHPEGQLIVTANWDSTIKIFDILHRTRKAVLRGHMTSVRAVAYSSDGCHIASAALDGDVKIWSATKGVQVGNVRGHGGPINKLTFSPTGQELITASDDNKVKVWSGELGVPLQVIGSEENGAANSVSLSLQGTTVAVGYHTGCVRVFDVATGVTLWETRPHSMSVRAVAYSNDDCYVVTGSDDTKVHVLESTHGTKVCTMEGHSKAVLSVLSHRKAVATTSEDCTCCLYPPIRFAKSSKTVKPMATLRGHVGPVTSCTFSPGCKKLATSSRDMSVCIWDFEMCCVDPDPTPEVTLTQCHADWVNACKWGNMAEFLVTASNDFNLKVWDVETKEEKYQLQGHTSSVNTVAYKFGCVVSGASDGQVKVWSHRGTEITTLYGHTQRVNSCDAYVKARSTDGQKVGEEADKDSSGGVPSWGEEMDDDGGKGADKSWAEQIEEQEKDEQSGSKKSGKKTQGLNVLDVVVASCSDDGTVRLWRPLETNSLACLTGHSGRVMAVAADREGRMVSVGLDRSLRLWSPALVSDMKVAGQHNVEVTCVSAGLQGNWVLTADRSGVVNVWQNKNSGFECVNSFKAHEKSVNAACFVNRGSTRFVTASDDMMLVEWDIMQRKDSVIVRKKKEAGLNAPVTSVVWDPSLMPGHKDAFVLGTDWQDSVFYRNLETGKETILYCSHSTSPPHVLTYSYWPLSLKVIEGMLFMTATDGTVSSVDCRLDDKKVELKERSKTTVPIKGESSDRKASQNNWIFSAASTQDGRVVGDSLGQLSLFSSGEFQRQMKVHSGAITSVVDCGYIFTASHDCTIKVWTSDFTQVGQFYCQAPVTSLCRVGAIAPYSKLMAGDQLGNVYLLTWRH